MIITANKQELFEFKDLLALKPHLAPAHEYAKAQHAGTFRKYTDEEYIIHCERVCLTVFMWGADDEVLMAALLHDTIEDTDTTEEELTALFGNAVTMIVKSVTIPNIPTNAQPLLKHQLIVGHTSKGCARSKLLKLADIKDNTRDMHLYDKRYAKSYYSKKLHQAMACITPETEQYFEIIKTQITGNAKSAGIELIQYN